MARRFKVETIFSGIDRISAPLTRMQARITRFSRTVRRRLDSMSQTAARWQQGLFTGLRRGGVALAATVAGLVLAVTKYTGVADGLVKRARRLDFPVEELQEWGFVAEQAGFQSAEFDKGLEILARRMGEMRAGTGTLYSYLARTDRQLLRSLQQTESMSDALDLIVEKIRAQPDAFRRAALSNAAFGRQGLKMANLTEMGAESIAKLRAEMRENGLITESAANDAEDFNDALNSTKKAVEGLRNVALAPMVPMLTILSRRTREWINANRDLVAGSFNNWVLTAIENYDKITNGILNIGKAMTIFVVGTSLIRTMSAALVGLTAALRGVAMMWGLFNAAFVASPVGRMVLAVGATVGAAKYIVDDIKAEIEHDGVGRFILRQTPFGGLREKERMDEWARRGELPPIGWRPHKPEGAAGEIRGLFPEAGAMDRLMGQVRSTALGIDPETGETDVSEMGRTLQEIAAGVRADMGGRESVEVTIKDETGRAEVTSGGLKNSRLIMEHSGVMW